MFTLLLALVSGPPSSAREQITYRPAVTTPGGPVHLADVADLSVLPTWLKAKAGDLIIVQIDRKTQIRQVQYDEISSRARSQLPILGPWLPSGDSGALTVHVVNAADRFMEALCNSGVVRGDRLHAEGDFGMVRVRRDVTAMQDGAPGGLLLARGSDGAVIRVYCREPS